MVLPRHPLAAVLAAAACGCSFETAPLLPQATQDAGVVRAFDAAVIEQPATASPDAGQSQAVSTADAAPPVQTMPMDASTAPPPAAGSQAPMIDAAAAPVDAAPAAVDAAPSGDAAPPVIGCEGTGSYGLRLALDLTWASTSYADPGRGAGDVYALVHVEEIDPQSHALTATAQLCGITLPTISVDKGCARYQIRFADTLWSKPELPMPNIAGSYTCDPTSCSLKLDPTAFELGIRLASPDAAWPAAGETKALQFVDDDGDGMPGVSAELASLTPTNQSCDETYSAPGMPAMAPAQRLLLALRAQLTAAVGLTPDCKVAQASGSAPAIDLRAAGCAFPTTTAGGPTQSPGSANATSCPAQLHTAIDESLPQFHALAAGAKPSSFLPASRGPQLSAVRIAAGAPATCQQVRAALP